MIDILKQIFALKAFTQNNFSDGIFFKPGKDANYINYWLIVKYSNLSEVLDKQDNWFDEIKNIENDSNIDKNTSLLILHELKEDSVSIDKDLILKIEENPYQFKKYVLCYKGIEEAELNKAILDSKLNTLAFVEKNIIEKEVFSVYKENPKAFNWQSLIFRLSLKLPLIKIDVLKDEGLGSLFATNNAVISKSESKKIDNLIKEHIDGINNEDINEQLDPLTILELLNSIDKEDENNNK